MYNILVFDNTYTYTSYVGWNVGTASMCSADGLISSKESRKRRRWHDDVFRHLRVQFSIAVIHLKERTNEYSIHEINVFTHRLLSIMHDVSQTEIGLTFLCSASFVSLLCTLVPMQHGTRCGLLLWPKSRRLVYRILRRVLPRLEAEHVELIFSKESKEKSFLVTLLELIGSVSGASVLSSSASQKTKDSADMIAMNDRASYGRGHIFSSESCECVALLRLLVRDSVSWKSHLQSVMCTCLGDAVHFIKEETKKNLEQETEDSEKDVTTSSTSTTIISKETKEMDDVAPESEYHDKAVVLSSGLGLPIELCELALEKFGGNENNAAEFAFLNLDNMDVLIRERRKIKSRKTLSSSGTMTSSSSSTNKNREDTKNIRDLHTPVKMKPCDSALVLALGVVAVLGGSREHFRVGGRVTIKAGRQGGSSGGTVLHLSTNTYAVVVFGEAVSSSDSEHSTERVSLFSLNPSEDIEPSSRIVSLKNKNVLDFMWKILNIKNGIDEVNTARLLLLRSMSLEAMFHVRNT